MNYIIAPTDNDILHYAKGSESKTHKYVSRYKKNGRWYYTYKDSNSASVADKVGITSYQLLKEREKQKDVDADKAGKFETGANYSSLPGDYENVNPKYKEIKNQAKNSYYMYYSALNQFKNTPLGKIRDGLKSFYIHIKNGLRL